MRLTETPPVQCSVCFQQNPQMLHVDMDAAYDGPLLDISGARHSADDIIICEDCLRAATGLLPEATELRDAYEELYERYRQAVDYAAKVQAGIGNFEEALMLKLEPSRRVTQTQGRRPRATGGVGKVQV